ncbi:hypothetical protein M8J76_003793 [Diaphorina citri]|nr:hypothetical protein M8J75_008692 [Diaphorina citri]KAI5740432.1 hypothetical protein M8J76_003793 [Diaphorina citri]
MFEPVAAESDSSTDDDVISEDYVAELINQRFDLLSQHNNIPLLYEPDDMEQDYLDTKCLILDGFEKVLELDAMDNEHQDINVDSDIIFIGPRPLITRDTPTCSKFDNLNENAPSTLPLKNNQFSNYEEFQVDRTYPLELLKSNRYDTKIFKTLLNERFKSNDPNVKKIRIKLESIINEQHKVLMNIINNNLDINRMYLEQQIRKTRRHFRLYINKLIDENYHIAYNEAEFTRMIEKKLLEDIEKLKSRIKKHINVEKYNAREVFFKTINADAKLIEKHFNFVQFLYSLTTLLDNKIEIVNNCVRNDMDHVINMLRKDIKNFISNRVILPSHDKWASIGNFIAANKTTPAVYNETIFINNNFHDARELLVHFETLPIRTAEIKLNNSTTKQSKDVKRIFDEIAETLGPEDSDYEQDHDLKFLIHQLGLLKENENLPLIEPITTNVTSKSKIVRKSNKEFNSNLIIRSRTNSLQIENNKLKNGGLDPSVSSIPNRKIIRAKRMHPSKVHKLSNLETIREKSIPEPQKPSSRARKSPFPPRILSSSVSNDESNAISSSTDEPHPMFSTQNEADALTSILESGSSLSNDPQFLSNTTSHTLPSNTDPHLSRSGCNDECPPTYSDCVDGELQPLHRECNAQPTTQATCNTESPTMPPTCTPEPSLLATDRTTVQDISGNPGTSSATTNIPPEKAETLLDVKNLILLKLNEKISLEDVFKISEIQLEQHEQDIVNRINDSVTQQIIVNDIERKMKEMETKVVSLYEEMVVAYHEYARLVKYKEEINKEEQQSARDDVSQQDERERPDKK